VSAVCEGRLIAVSGVDGSGKSTLIAGLEKALLARGHKVTMLAALKPRVDSPAGWLAQLRPVPQVRQQAELLMAGFFALAFQDNQAHVVEPALDRGEWVLADRWGLDHVANQAALGIDPAPWRPALACVRRPDAHYLIDVPAQMAAARIASRGGDPGIGSGERFLRRCTERMRMAAADSDFAPVTILDGTLPRLEILSAVLDGLGLGARGL
jgi:dTMP kinase